jgi:hypothetical protein
MAESKAEVKEIGAAVVIGAAAGAATGALRLGGRVLYSEKEEIIIGRRGRDLWKF